MKRPARRPLPVPPAPPAVTGVDPDRPRPEDYLSLADVAAREGVDRVTVSKWTKGIRIKGTLVTLVADRVVGIRLKFLPATVDEFMQQCKAAYYPHQPLVPPESPAARARRIAQAQESARRALYGP